ncbi:hypothetical protein DMUE_5849, partial [Dictyocoela muelleri]
MKEFGTPRIQRWIERLGNFDFEVKYCPGKNMIRPDTLSRLINDNSNNLNIKSNLINLNSGEIIKKIIKLHENTGHRKNLINEIKKLGIPISKAKLNNILS